MFGLNAFELDGDLLAGDDVGTCSTRGQRGTRAMSGRDLSRTEVDVAKAAATNLSSNAVFIADTKILKVKVWSATSGSCMIRDGGQASGGSCGRSVSFLETADP